MTCNYYETGICKLNKQPCGYPFTEMKNCKRPAEELIEEVTELCINFEGFESGICKLIKQPCTIKKIDQMKECAFYNMKEPSTDTLELESLIQAIDNMLLLELPGSTTLDEMDLISEAILSLIISSIEEISK